MSALYSWPGASLHRGDARLRLEVRDRLGEGVVVRVGAVLVGVLPPGHRRWGSVHHALPPVDVVAGDAV
jgi:hypothetical protein